MITRNGILQTEDAKIDNETVLGLQGTNDSLAYRVHEIEGHLHSAGRFFGYSGTPNDTAIIDSLTPWVLTTGTGDYGTAIQLFDGNEDFVLPYTPVKFDPHRLFVVDASDDGLYKIRIANSQWNGTSHTYASMAEAVAAKKFSESIIDIADDKKPEASVPVQTGRATCGSKVWAQVWSSVNGADISIIIGVHAYIG